MRSQNSKSCTKRWGPEGSKGRSSTKKFASKQECQEHVEEAIEAKRATGYAEPGKKRKLSSDSDDEPPRKRRKRSRKEPESESESEAVSEYEQEADEEEEEEEEGIFDEMVFVYSGSFSGFTQKEIKAMITDNGGQIKSGVTSKVDCVVVDGSNPNLSSSKVLCYLHPPPIPLIP